MGRAPENNDEDRPPAPVTLDEQLTAGYAHALLLESECVANLRRISALTEEGPSAENAEEIAKLAARLGEAQRELAELRSTLDQLRRQIDPHGNLY